MTKSYEDASVIARDTAVLDDWLGLGTPHRLVVAGGAAGDFTVAGMTTTCLLKEVIYYAGAGSAITDVADLTSEFTIAVGKINNAAGTDTTDGKLLVRWVTR